MYRNKKIELLIFLFGYFMYIFVVPCFASKNNEKSPLLDNSNSSTTTVDNSNTSSLDDGGTSNDPFRDSLIVIDNDTDKKIEEFRIEIKKCNEETQKWINDKIAECLDLTSKNGGLERSNNELKGQIIQLEDENGKLKKDLKTCGCLKPLDYIIKKATCQACSPDLSRRLSKRFWYGSIFGTIITAMGLIVLYVVK